MRPIPALWLPFPVTGSPPAPQTIAGTMFTAPDRTDRPERSLLCQNHLRRELQSPVVVTARASAESNPIAVPAIAPIVGSVNCCGRSPWMPSAKHKDNGKLQYGEPAGHQVFRTDECGSGQVDVLPVHRR
jgi:hypothetical protein